MKAMVFSALILFLGLSLPVKAYAQWQNNNSNIYYNGGNVGIGTNSPPDPLTINTSTPGDWLTSSKGKLYVGDGVGSWWIMGGKGNNGFGYNNIASNSYLTDNWYRRENTKETWIMSNYITNNNSGYFRIFHADPQSTSSISNLRTFFSIDSYGNTKIDGSLAVKELKVKSNVWADYVFSDNYKLQSLASLEDYIKTNKHLPNIPSSEEVSRNNISVSEMLKLQMEKIEELTLYIIQKDKEVKDLQLQVNLLKSN